MQNNGVLVFKTFFILMRYLLTAGVLLLSILGYAQPSFPPPSGVYCSCGPTTGNGYGSVNPQIASKPFVQGILVRVGWNILEPADDTYDWALIDTQINRARQYGKKVSLGIGSGIMIPQWVFDGGAQRLVSTSPINDTLAVPWDAFYLTKWKELISALGSRYQNDTTIQLVYITHSTANGFEMQLPRVVTPTLSAVGYTDKKMADSWKEVIDAFSAAFPNHYLSNDFHPVNNSNDVADSVYAYAVNTVGTRYGAAAWWWTQKNTGVYPAQYTIMQNSAANNNFSAVQFARNGTTDSAAFGPGGMPGAMQLAINDGICYWEIWNEDILNPDFDSLLSNAGCTTTGISNTVNEQRPGITIYPNPATKAFTITASDRINGITITNLAGAIIYNTAGNRSVSLHVDMEAQPRGIYLVRVQTTNNTYYQKLVLQ